MGAPTTFVRTSGCPLRCAYCDTKQAYDEGSQMTVEAILKAVKKHGARHVCLTGGEPLVQRDAPSLVKKLLEEGYKVVVETNGAMPLDEMPCDDNLSISMDIKCPSSGESDKMLFSNLEMLGPTDQLKFVVSDEADYEYAKKVIRERSPKCEVILTPVGGKDLKWLAEEVLRDKLDVRVLPQLHKIIWGDEDDR
ncbi:MAG: 7-carboxy-7-deazaguanine synthase [Candidatus Thermoplasmatota archaeon]|nr:7-carboxy-7-deazaguanine synthase [Candidatus Thermoplasmatota archaeon]